jgi:2-polyprenyl-3-methyl-5-hydroxy-6-metoxy-1,4-benzoquinol methylase
MYPGKLTETEYFNQNKSCWDDRVPVHMNSGFYDLDRFISGASSLTEIEQQFLPNVSGKSILHLQCHFGMDTLSLSRMGASCTGIDFSGPAIEEARKLNDQLSQQAVFYECNVYDLPQLKLKPFDMVFTTYGTIGWLPDLNRWSKVISESLKPGGELFFCDFHPCLYMFDFNTHQMSYSYFNTGLPYSENEAGTYADRNYSKEMISHFWSHSLSEIISNLIENGLQIMEFREFDFSPYSCFPNMKTIAPGRYRYGSDENKIPHLYLIRAMKN